ncbi:MerR family transcriptional regulator [Fructobacillus parabroussonetiae]|uniref:MerR family transcriptional regulator n=1 Tax=Fructobacillus parabroussonetiae TaxID=2713174 RepID=A0ABS5QVP8_9LACO|nr:MerR family transcriptional regulator [Fructobacillus parabroussonetiae]
MKMTIGEVSKKSGLSISTIRYYDKEGLFPDLQRTSGIRQFSEQEINALEVIECLKKSGLSILEIRQFMDWTTEGAKTFANRKALFEQQKIEVEQQMAELKRVSNLLNYKCWYYDEAMKRGSEKEVRAIPFDELPKAIQEDFPFEH